LRQTRLTALPLSCSHLGRRLHLDDNPEPVRPTDCSFSLEEADHGYLVGGSTSSLASMDSAPSAPAGNVVAFRKAVAAAARVHAN
jgi:hypothetical protein